MYKLLIADDERGTRDGLLAWFEKNPCGFEIVGTADGGLQALALARQYQPDLLLTDVRMPDLDGLTLARRCLELPNPPHLLIMSAYMETQYIKSALKLRAVNYLIKPIDLMELKETMLRIRQQLEEEERERRSKETLRKGLHQSLSWLRGHFLGELLDGICTVPAEIEQQLDFLGMDLPEIARYCTVSVRIEPRSACFGSDPGDNSRKMYSLRKLLEDILSMYAEGYVFERERSELAVVVIEHCDGSSPDLFEQDMKNLCQEMFSALRLASADTTIGLGKQVMARHQLPFSYQKARENIQARLILGNNQVISDYETSKPEKENLFTEVKLVKDKILSSDSEALVSAIDCFFAHLAACPGLEQTYAIQCAGLLLHVADEVLIENGWSARRDPGAVLQAYGKLSKSETLPDMKAVTAEYVLRINRMLCSHMTAPADETVEKIRTIIRRHYRDNLTIQSIAEQIYLSPNYICMVFKQVTGQTINQYTTQVRMEQAKKLLEQTDVRITDIGAEVGYAEPGYFNKIFKKYVALTPKEYRQMVSAMGKK